MDWWRDERDMNALVLLARLLTTAGSRSGMGSRGFRCRKYLKDELPCAGHKTLAIILWIFGAPADLFIEAELRAEEGKVEEAERLRRQALVELLLGWMAVAQVIHDSGSWRNAWPLSLSLELPWGVMNRAPRVRPRR